MPPESDHNSPSERVLSAIDSLRTAYYGVETDNPWRTDSAKELLESLTKDLDEEDIKNMEDTVNAVLKTRPVTVTEKITTHATKGDNNKPEPAKSSLKPSSPTPVEYPSLHDLYNQFQQFKNNMELDGETEDIENYAENLQGEIDNLTIKIAELKQKKTKDEKDAAKLKKLTLDREQLLIQKKTLNFIVKNPNGMNPKMHLFLDAGKKLNPDLSALDKVEIKKQLESWDRQQLHPIFRTLPNSIIRFITRLRVFFSSELNKTRESKKVSIQSEKIKEKMSIQVNANTTTPTLDITKLNDKATEDFTVLDAIKDTALAMQKAANTLNTQSVAVTKTTPTLVESIISIIKSLSSNTNNKNVHWDKSLTTTSNPENESTLTATTKLARAILRSQFTKNDMLNLKRTREKIYFEELNKLQKSNPTDGRIPTETEKKQADTTTRNLFRDAEAEVQKMITEDNGSRAIACLADTIESRAGLTMEKTSKSAVRSNNTSNNNDKISALKETYESLCGWAPNEDDKTSNLSTSNNNPWCTQYQNIQWSSAFLRKSETQSNNQTDTFANFWGNNSSLIYRILKASYVKVDLEAQKELHNARINRLISHLQSMDKDDNKSSNTTTRTSSDPRQAEYANLINALKSHQDHDWFTWHHEDKAGLEEYQEHIKDHLEAIQKKIDGSSLGNTDITYHTKSKTEKKEENQNRKTLK